MSAPETERMLGDYLDALRVRGLSPSTLRGRAQVLRRFLARLEAEGREPRAATRADVEAHAAALFAVGMGACTVRGHLLALAAFFTWAETVDAVLVNPCAGVALPKLPDALPRRVLTAPEVARVLAQPDTGTDKGRRDRALLEVFYAAGLRCAEAAALGVHDLDLGAGLVRVARGKGGRGRVAPLGASAVAALRAYLDTRRAWLAARALAAGAETGEAALWLSPIQPHRPLKKEALAMVVRQCAERAGVGKVGPHAWRHTCATHLLRGGAPLPYVQRLLGHRSMKTTQIYTRVEPGEVRAMLQARHPRA